MRADLTHPWGTKHWPNLLHRPGLTPGDEAPELSLRLDTFSVQGQKIFNQPRQNNAIMTP
jgi:hypothetical protein